MSDLRSGTSNTAHCGWTFGDRSVLPPDDHADARRPPDRVEAATRRSPSRPSSRRTPGRWKVEIVVIFPDEAVRRTINHYRTQRHAEIAASWIKRAAQRDIEGPLHG